MREELTPSQDSALRLALSDGKIGSAQLGSHLEIGSNSARAMLVILSQRGYLVREGGTGANQAKYSITRRGERAIGKIVTEGIQWGRVNSVFDMARFAVQPAPKNAFEWGLS